MQNQILSFFLVNFLDISAKTIEKFIKYEKNYRTTKNFIVDKKFYRI